MTNRPAGREPCPVLDDGVVLAQIGRGNLLHFDAFVDRYKTRLLAYIHHRIDDIHRAEDITQEVFLRAFRTARRGAYRGGASAGAWLFVIARNCITDYLRACGRRTVVYQGDLADDDRLFTKVHHPAQTESNPRLSRIADRGGVEAILARLPEPQREVLALKVFSELTFAEIAEVVDCGLSTVKSRMRYAVAKVRELLTQAEDAENG